MKGFATSLSIIISFLASVVLFSFSITPSFVVGATIVLSATWMYNQPDKPPRPAMDGRASAHSYPGSPVPSDAPIIDMPELDKKRSSLNLSYLNIPLPSPRALADKIGFSRQNSESALPVYVLGMSDANSSAVSLSSVESGRLSRDPSSIHMASSGYTTRSTIWTGRPSTSISSATSSRASSPPLTRPPSTGAR
jgi:Nucleotide-sugar transporter